MRPAYLSRRRRDGPRGHRSSGFTDLWPDFNSYLYSIIIIIIVVIFFFDFVLLSYPSSFARPRALYCPPASHVPPVYNAYTTHTLCNTHIVLPLVLRRQNKCF
jgi:hypothetical protein